jgi:(E)-4-hydroxy-3-methylbut-2-enyl-diphosphate synthase
VDGRLMTTLRGDRIVQDFTKILDEYVRTRYGSTEKAEQLVEVH